MSVRQRSILSDVGESVGEGFVLPVAVIGIPLSRLLSLTPELRPLRSLLPLLLCTAGWSSGSASPPRLPPHRLPSAALRRKAWRLPETTWYLPGKPCWARPRLFSGPWPRDWMKQMIVRGGRKRGRGCHPRWPFLLLVLGPSVPWEPRVDRGPAHFLLCLLVLLFLQEPNLSPSLSPRHPRSSPPLLPRPSPPLPTDPRAGRASRGGGHRPCFLP